MSYQQNIFSLISSLVGQNNNIVIPVEMIRFTGDYHIAALLSQIIYWTGKQRDPAGWIYKTYDQWGKELVLSKYQTSRASNELVKMGILETKVARVRLDNGMLGDRAVHYRLRQDEFTEKFTKHLSILESKETSLSKVKELNFPKSSSLTNLTIDTENTSINYDNVPAPPPTVTEPKENEERPSSSFSEIQLLSIIATLMGLVPEQHRKPSIEKAIERGLKANGEDYIRAAIFYTVYNSNGGTTQKFRAYLGKCIENHWHAGWAPDKAPDQSAIKKEFASMPDEVLRMLADAGNQIAADELRKRADSQGI